MQQNTYWHKQTEKPLFPDIEWSKPEQKSLAGKLLIIGGNKLGFAAVNQAYEDASKAGIGEAKVVLPDALKPMLKSSGINCVYVPTNPSGGMNKESIGDLKTYMQWGNATLFIGDSGRNSETAILYEQLLNINQPIILTRDALDLVRAQADQWLNNSQICAVATFAQLQKIFQNVHYPKILLFSMQLTQLVDALHKFTITYDAKIITLHQNHLIVADSGEVSTTPIDDNLAIWRGKIASYAAVYWLQNQTKPFEALTSAVIAANKIES